MIIKRILLLINLHINIIIVKPKKKLINQSIKFNIKENDNKTNMKNILDKIIKKAINLFLINLQDTKNN